MSEGPPAPRTHPHTYPGPAPVTDVAVVDGAAIELSSVGLDADRQLDAALPDGTALSAFLADRSEAPLSARVPVLAYGANRIAATLAIKMAHHGGPTRSVLPVLRCTVRAVDIVAGGFAGQGYPFADVLVHPTMSAASVEVAIGLLDDDQRAAVDDSEGVGRDPGYVLGRTGPVELLAGPTFADALMYVGPHAPPQLDGRRPWAFDAIPAEERRLPASDPVGMLAALLDGTAGLTDELRAVVGTAEPAELVRLVNGAWWVRHHTGATTGPVAAATRVIRDAMAATAGIPAAREELARRGALLGADLPPRVGDVTVGG